MNIYQQGNVVVCATITPFTYNLTPTNPNDVYFVCKKPDGSYVRAHWNHLTGDITGTIVNDSPGNFHADVHATVVGTTFISSYEYHWYSPDGDPVQGSSATSFGVQAVSLV